jgi:hypothetical protein
MKISRYIILLALAILLALSVFVAQVAFRLERTVLSYGFTYRETQSLLAPLDDTEIHAQSIGEAFRFVRKQLSFQVPRDIEETIIESAVSGFSAAWVKQTVGLWLVTAQQVLHGKRDSIEIPLALAPFKNSFISAVRGRFTIEEQMEIHHELDQIPATIDLASEIPDALKARILGIGRSMALSQIILQYIVPGLFISACFFHRRIGTGLISVGLGLTIGGLPALYYTAFRAGGVARNYARMAVRDLPDFAAWLGDGVESTLFAILQSGILTAVLVTVFGLLFLIGGGYLLIRKGDPQIQFRAG